MRAAIPAVIHPGMSAHRAKKRKSNQESSGLRAANATITALPRR